MDIQNAFYGVEMADGSRWIIPLRIIAEDHALAHKRDFNDDLQRSLDATWRLFEEDDLEAADWAKDMIPWDHVESSAKQIRPPFPPVPNYDYDWAVHDGNIIEYSEIISEELKAAIWILSKYGCDNPPYSLSSWPIDEAHKMIQEEKGKQYVRKPSAEA